MSGLIDLHCHSTASDGTLRPAELVKRAREQGVELLALTDHDSVQGIAEASDAARMHKLELVAGVEISVSWRSHTVHILGLDMNPGHAGLQEGLAWLAQRRVARARRIAAKLARHPGLEDAWEAAVGLASCEAVTRTHFARLLVQRGLAGDMGVAFKRWLGRKGKAFVPGDWASLEQAVGWITAAGGLAVIAHPARYRMTHTRLAELIEDFKRAGGVGLEVVSSAHSPQERASMATLARRHGLLASAGSDFHAPGNPRVELGRGLELPQGCPPIWVHFGRGGTAALCVGS